MRVHRDHGLAVAWLATSLAPPQPAGVFMCKATFPLIGGAREPLAAAESLPSGDVAAGHLAYPSDFVPFKPRADVMVLATAHAPTGKPARYLRVSFQTGALQKQLLVAGDRRWKLGLLGRSPSEPEPFQVMPVTWTRALGGAKDPGNPIGRGREGDLLPNVEIPDRLIGSPGDRIPPAGFGPIPADWEPRRSLVGTYRGNYVKERWPWFPKDFDFGYFNAAPRDQQVEGYLRGDEELEFENLHREHPMLKARLPGLRARVFVTFDDGEFREVPQRLDTLLCDLERDRLVLVWRGHTDVRGPMMHEIVHVLAAFEPLDSANTPEQYRGLRDAVPAVEQEESETQAAAAEQDGASAASDAAVAVALAEADALIAARLQSQQKLLAELGVDPAVLQPEPQTLDDVKAQLAAQRQLRLQHPQAPGLTIADLDAIDGMLADAEPEPPRPAGWTRETVLAAVAAGRDLGGEDLSGLDLSGCALAGAKLSRALLANCNLSRADLKGATLTLAILTGAKLDGADLGGAVLDDCDCTGASLRDARLAGGSFARAVLEQQDLSGCDLSGCRGEAVHLAGSDLGGCQLSRAELPKADFTGCKLVGADWTSAVLRDARLHGADASRGNFQGADLRGMRADDGARFVAADFRHARADGVVLEFANLHGADLRYASLPRALLTGADLGQCDLSRADLEHASLADASLVGARLLQTNLRYASLDRADLKGADLRQANLYGAGLWQTKAELADLRETNLAATLMTLR